MNNVVLIGLLVSISIISSFLLRYALKELPRQPIPCVTPAIYFG